MSQSLRVTDLREMGSQAVNAPEFADVFDEFQRPIYNYLLRMTQSPPEADDLTQETFIRIHRSLPYLEEDL